MKYYEAHDREYKKLFKAGRVAWDEGDYESFDMLGLVERFLKESNFSPSVCRALDLGCGTGGLACYLSMQGFNVTAIDISATAIREAKKQAEYRNLNIDFQVADLCSIELPKDSFDLITDNHFLHCIVFPGERKRVLWNIYNTLKPDGEYWIEVMVGHPQMKPRAEWNMDADGVTWMVVGDDERTEECVEHNGRILCPIRRIQPCEQILMDEIQEAGLAIIWHETSPPVNENDTGTFRAKYHKKQP